MTPLQAIRRRNSSQQLNTNAVSKMRRRNLSQQLNTNAVSKIRRRNLSQQLNTNAVSRIYSVNSIIHDRVLSTRESAFRFLRYLILYRIIMSTGYI